MNKREVLFLGLVLIVLIGLLAAGLQTIEFRGGRLPVPDPEEPDAGEPILLPFPYELLKRLLEIMPWFILWVIILGFILFRETRRKIIIALLILALTGFVCQFIELPTENEIENNEEEINDEEPWEPPWGPPWEPEPTDPPHEPTEAPWWLSYFIAALLAIPLIWLGWRVIRRVTQKYEKITPEEEFRKTATQATDELKAGLPVEEVVIRCWNRMAEILSKRVVEGTNPAVTPRELARVLAKWGMRDQAITELTKLFEEVRYGAKADIPRRDRALAALAAIEEIYDKPISEENKMKNK